MKRPELLAPVADHVMLRAAIQGGADAIYFGIKELNMRIGLKGSRNFELADIRKVVSECHKENIKAYLTLNTIVFEDELDKMRDLLQKAKEAEVDAIICWDMSVIQGARKIGLEVHLSTQASVSNSASALFYKNLGVTRIIPARECNIPQIAEMRKRAKVEIEAFVHGAMCVSISGRCFMSEHIFGKSANRGQCIQPCRREMTVTDEEGRELIVGNNYILSPKDLCTVDILPKLMDAGIDALKIEGRNRSPEYVKVVTECYGEAIDFIIANRDSKGFEKDYSKMAKALREKLNSVYNRGFSTGFYMGLPIDEWAAAYGSKASERKQYIGFVKNYYPKVSVAEIKLETTDLEGGDRIMFQGNKTGVIEQKVTSMQIDKRRITAARKGERVAVKTKEKVRVNDKVYKILKA